MLDEVWVELENYPGYAISNFGTILDTDTDEDAPVWEDEDGYMRVMMFGPVMPEYILVHELVAEAFFLNFKPGVKVNHINGDKHENTVLNLSLELEDSNGHGGPAR